MTETHIEYAAGTDGGLEIWRFRVEGKPKPYVRMTQRSKYVDPEAQAYLASRAAMGMAMRSQMNRRGWEMIERGVPLAVIVEFYYATGADHRRDLDNEVKAVLDAANKVVWHDDNWVDQLSSYRGPSSDGRDWVVLEVARLGAGDGEA